MWLKESNGYRLKFQELCAILSFSCNFSSVVACGVVVVCVNLNRDVVREIPYRMEWSPHTPGVDRFLCGTRCRGPGKCNPFFSPQYFMGLFTIYLDALFLIKFVSVLIISLSH